MININEQNKYREAKVFIYDNERMRIQYNLYNPFEERIMWAYPPPKIRNYINPYMTTKQYVAVLRENRKQLFKLKFDESKCLFLTLTTKDIISWNDIKVKFQSFMRCVKRTFGKFHYVRVIESHEKETHYHLHIIFKFEKDKPIAMTKDWVNQHWKYGISDYQFATEPYGVLDYITLFKQSNINPENKHFTKFPQFVKLFTRSLKFPQAEEFEIETTIAGAKDLLDDLNEKCRQKTGQDLYCFNDGHYYIDYETGEYAYCLDKQFYHKPFIEG